MNAKVVIEEESNLIILPKLMTNLKHDFGTTNLKLIEFTYKYLDDPEVNLATVINLVCKEKSMALTFE